MLCLASASPRRAELLRAAGVPFSVLTGLDVDESHRPGESPVAYARRVAADKLHAAQTASAPARAIVTADEPVWLTADTTVWIDSAALPLAKPADRADAARMLRLLSGRTHFVSTAFAIGSGSGTDHIVQHCTTVVEMRPIDEPTLGRYLDLGEWTDKAGGYGIQGHAGALVLDIEGSYSNVVGLPVAQVLAALRPLGVEPFTEGS